MNTFKTISNDRIESDSVEQSCYYTQEERHCVITHESTSWTMKLTYLVAVMISQ